MDYGYDAVGRVGYIGRANSLESTYSYDAAGSLLRLVHGYWSESTSIYDYHYTPSGNRSHAGEYVSQPASVEGFSLPTETPVAAIQTETIYKIFLPLITRSEADFIGEYTEAQIEYTYDPLGRLKAADYEDERYFHYTYDAVGNRLTVTTPDGTVDYAYDNANRLESVDNVTYTWDNNGNLLDDEVNGYTYDSANRLISVTGPSGMTTYSYDGLGNRYQQTVNEVTTTYTLDTASGLTQVLSDGTNKYLYGMGRIAQVNGEDIEYFLGDALGSVRQLTDESGEIILTREYDPYGNVLSSVGTVETKYGFTNEYTSQGLIYLRARYYNPNIGRFTTVDPSQQEANLYLYAGANPVNETDPTGFLSFGYEGPLDFMYCFALHSGFPTALGDNGSPINSQIPAWYAVALCKQGMDRSAWSAWKGIFPDTSTQGLPTTAHDLFGRWLFGYGDTNHLYFDGNQPLTRELAISSLVQDIRTGYYMEGKDIGCYNGKCPLDEFLTHQFAESIEQDSWISIGKFLSSGQLSIPLTFFMGSFYYQVKALHVNGGIRIGFRIDNDTGWESGTHIVDRFRPEYNLTVEDLINGPNQYGVSASTSLSEVFQKAPVISILSNRSRSDLLGTGFGGGTLYQTYTWSERFDPCFAQWSYAKIRALGNLFLDIQPWDGSGTTDPYAN